MSYLRWSLIAGMLMITGCASLPSPTETNGGMLAFPMEVSGPGTFYYVYEYTVFDAETDTEVDRIQMNPTRGINVSTFGPLPPGDYYLGTKTTRVKPSPSMNFQYTPNPRDVNFPFTIEEDTITLLDKKLVVHKRSRDGGGFSTSSRQRNLTIDVQTQALADLRAQDEDGLWRIKAPHPEPD